MSKVIERWVDGDVSRGEFHIVKTQDCSELLRAIHELPEHIRYRRSSQTGVKILCSLPPLIAVNWSKEWGVRLYTAEFNRLARQRIMTDPNWNKLRIAV